MLGRATEVARLIDKRRLENGKRCVEASRGMWDIGYSPVTERFFSGVPHAHLLGVCHRAVFFVHAQPPEMEGASIWGGWAATPPN